MDKVQLEAKQQELEAKEKELQQLEQRLSTKKQKLDEFAIKLKKEQEKLYKDRESYQQKADSLEATFNDRVNKGIEKQREAIQKEQEALLEKDKKYLAKELEFKERENQLSLKKAELDNTKKELENSHEAKLQEKNRTKMAEFASKLEDEFNAKFKEKIALLNQFEEELAEQKARLKEQEVELEIEKKAFETSKQKERERLEYEMQTKLDTLENRCESEKEERKKLQTEYDYLIESYGEYERFKDRDLISEIDILEKERLRLEKRLEEVAQEAEKRMAKADEKKSFYTERLDEIKQYDELEAKFYKLQKDYNNQAEQLEEQGYYKNECKILEDRLKHLQSQFIGKEEQIKREEAIKQDYTLEILLNHENKNKEKDELKWLENIQKGMEEYGVKYPKRLLYAFHTALKTASMSPLSVLSGVSGTGKSELPKLYAFFGGFNFLSEAVQPTWDSPASMIGFYNTIEGKFDSTKLFKFLVQTSINSKQSDENAPNPYGLKESMNLILLDELNLAHIELYFAEFLSKFETKRGSDKVNLDIAIGAGLTMSIELDSNLLWVGTMNEDETTKSLSDKVLDRAFCLNFPRPNELISRLELKKLNSICEFKWLPKSTWEEWIKPNTKDIDLEKYRKITEQINEELAKAHRAIGHRVWQAMEAYMLCYPLSEDREKIMKIAFEDAVVQKIMPKLRGMELHGEEQKALRSIKDIIIKEVPNLEKDFDYAMSNPYGQFKFNSAYYLDLEHQKAQDE